MLELGSPGFKGYDYQITATVWIALDLFLVQQRSEEILVEPLSREDIEASISDNAEERAVSTVGTHHGIEHLYIQVKRRSTGPWSLSDFTDVFVGTPSDSKDRRSRQRPWEILENDPQARYLLLTDAAVNESLMPYGVSGLLLRHSSSSFPSSIKVRAKVSDSRAGQFAIFPMQGEELLNYRITDLLLRKGHVPSLRTPLCVEALRDQVRDRLLGKKPVVWSFADVSSTLRQFGGQPFINPRLAEYVAPLSYAEIESRLTNQNAVLLVGPPGTGKTMTSEIIAARFSADGVNIIREKSPEKIRELVSQSGRFLFLLSDPWGANRVDEKAPVNWTDELPKLLEFANPDKRFVITSRSDVLRKAVGEIVEDKQPNRKYALSAIVVKLLPEDYNSALRRKILRNKADRLSAWQQDFVGRNETAIIRKLRLPFSIEQFVFYLSQVTNPANANLEDLLNNADLDTIVNTVRQQVEAWGDGPVECATVAWALLNTWNPLELELSDLVTATLANSGLVLEMQSFFKHLVACGNVERDGTAIEAHPKVLEALEQVLAGKPSTAANTIQKLLTAIAGAAQSNAKVATLLFGIARALQSGTFPTEKNIPTHVKTSIFQIIDKKLASEERSVFLEGLREASEFNLSGQSGKLVRQLVGKSKGNDRWFRHWSGPAAQELTEEFTAGVIKSSAALNVLNRFVEFSLPTTEVTYPVQDFLGYLREFPVDLSSSFMSAFDAVVDRQQVCFNDDVIVTGALTDEASFEHVRARILKLWEATDAWFEGFNEQLSSSRECEIDAEYSAHLEEEPGEHYGLVEGLAKAYVAVRRDRQGWHWLTQTDNKRFISAWPEVISGSKATPSKDEWKALIKACAESHMSEYWSAVKAQRYWVGLTDVPEETFKTRYSAKAFLEALISSADPIAILKQISPSLDNSSRATLAITASGMSRTAPEGRSEDISNQSILDVLTKVSQSTNEARCLTMLFELVSGTPFSTIKEKYGTGPTRELQELARSLRSRNEYTCSCVAVLCAVFNEVDDSLLEDLLASSDTHVTENAALAVAVARHDSLLQSCLSHKHYQVRRTAFKALSRCANPELTDRLLVMAKDKSAAVRLEVARTIGNLEWHDGREMLVTLLSDSRDYSQDSLTGGWPCFEVARAAADSIQQIPLDDETERELVDFVEQGRKATADPIVRAKTILAVSNSQQPTTLSLFFRMLNSSLAIGKEPAPRYVLRCAAAEAIANFLARTPTILTSEQTDSLVRICQTQDAALSVRATVATALSFESTSEKFSQLPGISKRQNELFVVAALAGGKRVPVEFARALLGADHPLLSLLRSNMETGAAMTTLTPEIESWIDGLKTNEDVGRAILYTVNQWLGIASDEPKSPWSPDLEPQRIRTMTLRSMFGGE
jgi:hypothetical protein